MKSASSDRRPIHHSPMFWIGIALCLAAMLFTFGPMTFLATAVIHWTGDRPRLIARSYAASHSGINCLLTTERFGQRADMRRKCLLWTGRRHRD